MASPAALALLAIAAAVGTPAFGATLEAAPPADLARPPLELHPYAGVSETYDSNIYLRPEPTASWITVPRAGLRLAAASASGKHRLDLAYDVADRLYATQPAGNDAVVQGADAGYRYASPAGLALRARGSYLNTVDPASSELTARQRRWASDTGLELGYEPDGGPLFLKADAGETRHQYVADDPLLRSRLNRRILRAGVKAGWQALPKTVAYLAYHRELMGFTDHPDPGRDNRSHLVDAGVEGDLAPKTTGRLQVGLATRRYDAAPVPGLGKDATDVTALTSVAYRPTDNAKAELALTRQIEESAFDVDQFYVASRARLALGWDSPWRVAAALEGAVERDDYPVESRVGPLAVARRDMNYQAGLRLETSVRDWLKAGAAWTYRARFSRDLGAFFDYRDQLTTLSLTATF